MEEKLKSKKKIVWISIIIVTLVLLVGSIVIGISIANRVQFVNAEDKSQSDVEVLKEIVREQRKYEDDIIVSCEIDYDLNSAQYKWVDGRLTEIHWNDVSLVGDIDFSNLDRLEVLDVGENYFFSLVLKGNTSLKELNVSGNQYYKSAYLDLKECPNLKVLNCNGTIINNEIILDSCNVLEELYCDRCLVDVLDVSHNPKLRILDCSSNILDELDLSANPLLEELDCGYNDLNMLDVKENIALKVLNCSGNNLEIIDIKANRDLEFLDCSDNNFETLDLKENHVLKELKCFDNKIWKLDVSANKALTDLQKDPFTRYWTEEGEDVFVDEDNNGKHDVDEYILSEILAEQQKALELKDWEMHVLNWEEGRLTEIHWIRNGYPSLKGEISFAGLIDLEVLEITWNEELTGIDITQNEKLVKLICNRTDIATLDLSGNPNLEILDCEGNLLTQLNLSENKKLKELNCDYNQITELDLSYNTQIKELKCAGNQIASLNIINCIELERLECGYNEQLEELNVSTLEKLNFLWCNDTKIQCLDISNNSNIYSINCDKTLIKELDLRNNRQMGHIYISCGDDVNILTE